jgi:uncharacterized protein YbjQ (UPF0145 family)
MATCTKCKSEAGYFEMTQGLCPKCVAEQTASRERLLNSITVRPDPAIAENVRIKAELAAIILTTESSHNLDIAERLEIITAECVLGMNIFKDIGSALRDFVGGRNEAYQTALRDARKSVLAELRREAHAIGADAVVAVDLDYSEISGGGKSMLFLVASGTAVRLNRPD